MNRELGLRSNRVVGNQCAPRIRRGAALLIALVLLMILFAIGGTLISRVLQTRTQFIREEQLLQTRWLVEAGLQRAFVQWNRDPGFVGEVWEIPAQELAGFASAKVTLAVQPGPAASDQRLLTVTAEYPLELPQPIRLTRQLRLPRAEPQP